MATLFGKKYTRQELLTRIGDISQLGGVKLIELADGNERGVQAAEFKTGSGFNFTVLLDRGLDISAADYCGQSLCWNSSTGAIAPTFFEPEGLGWLRSFHGGLLMTCGLTYFGAPNVDQGQALGLHGRVSNIPAKNIYVDGKWEGDDYRMWIQGKVQETAVFQENLILHRRIWTRLGEKRLFIDDVVENAGYNVTEHMMLYHFNGGFPVVDAGSEIIAPFMQTEPRDEEAKVGQEEFFKFQGPTPEFKERVYYHDVAADEEGSVYSALINKSFHDGQGFGFYVKYSKEQLPILVEWKMNGQGVYVVGMEPGTNTAEGRAAAREKGTLIFLKPGETRSYNLEIGVLTGREAIAAFEEKIERIREDNAA